MTVSRFCFYKIKIEGKVEKLPDKESQEYFQSRPRGSQIGAIVSAQSSVIASREVLFQHHYSQNSSTLLSSVIICNVEIIIPTAP